LVKFNSKNGDAPDWRGTCAVCLDLLPLPGAGTQSFYECCCKRICTECSDKCRQHDKRCPLCRAPPIKTHAEWLRRLQKHVDKGNADAQFQLAGKYYLGDKGIKQSFKRAFHLYELAAAQGHALAQYNLGTDFNNGYGVKIDHKAAARWYRRAAEQGYPLAQLCLGKKFYKGQGVAQSFEEAARWLRLAAAQDEPSALFNLGVCYENGHGVPEDDHEALRFYKRAAAQGHAEAAAQVELLEVYIAEMRSG
jgi:TPR repeat protein